MARVPTRSLLEPQAYQYLSKVDAAGLAWEWLRRDAAFRRLAPSTISRTQSGAAVVEQEGGEVERRFHCLNVEDCTQHAGEAAVVWSAAADPYVLRASAVVARHARVGAFDLDRWGAAATLVLGCGGKEHLLLAKHGYTHRIDLLDGTLLDGPVHFRFDLDGCPNIEPTFFALRQFQHLRRGRVTPSRRARTSRQCSDQIDALRTCDALAEGASIRDVAIMLFGQERVEEDWHAPGEALKSRCRRVIGLARKMASGDWTMLLC